MRPRTWAVVLWCAVAVPSVVQVAWAPVLLEWGRRESSAVAAGQWWRLVTSIVLQDGGWEGTIFNLVMLGVTLLLVGAVCRVLPSVLAREGPGAGLIRHPAGPRKPDSQIG